MADVRISELPASSRTATADDRIPIVQDGATKKISPSSLGLATAAQGELATSALQSDDVAPVALSGSYNDLANRPAVTGYVVKDTQPTSADYGRDLINGDRWFNSSSGVEYTYVGGNFYTETSAGLTSVVGTYGNRPAANSLASGSLYFASDVKESYRTDGSNWVLIPGAGVLLYSAERTTSFTFNSTSPVDVTGLTVTMVVGERALVVEYGGTLKVTTDNTAIACLSLQVSGSQRSQIFLPGAIGDFLSVMRRTVVTGLTPGSTVTIKIQAFLTKSTGAGQLFGDPTDKSFMYVSNC